MVFRVAYYLLVYAQFAIAIAQVLISHRFRSSCAAGDRPPTLSVASLAPGRNHMDLRYPDDPVECQWFSASLTISLAARS